MAGNVERRVGGLEGRIGTSGGPMCACADGARVVLVKAGEAEPDAPVCPRCGRPMRTTYVRTQVVMRRGAEA